MVKLRPRNAGATPKVKGAQAAGSSTTNERQSIQENKESIATKDRSRKMEATETSKGDTVAVTPSKAKKAKNPKKKISVDESSSVYEPGDKLAGLPSTTRDQGCNKNEAISEPPADVLKTESLVGVDVDDRTIFCMPEEFSSIYSYYLSAGETPLPNIIVMTEEETIDDQKCNLDPTASKVTEELSAENGKKLTENNDNIDEPLSGFAYVDTPDNENPILGSETLEISQGLFSKDEKETTFSKLEVKDPVPIEYDFKDIDCRKVFSELGIIQQIEFSPEIDTKLLESKTDPKESVSLSQDYMLTHINNETQSLNLNTSKSQMGLSPENREKIIHPKTEEIEETINLSRGVNLRFEFDSHDNKKVFVDGKDIYSVDTTKNQKTTFIIGNGNLQLSFLGNRVSIFTKGGEINCSMLRNRILFSIMDSPTQSDPASEDPSTHGIPEAKDAKAPAKESDATDMASVAESIVTQPMKIQPQSDSGSVDEAKKTDSSVLPMDSTTQSDPTLEALSAQIIPEHKDANALAKGSDATDTAGVSTSIVTKPIEIQPQHASGNVDEATKTDSSVLPNISEHQSLENLTAFFEEAIKAFCDEYCKKVRDLFQQRIKEKSKI